MLALAGGAWAQTLVTSPAVDATCVVSALNRNASMDSGNSYFLIPGVPSAIGPYKVRAVCSDGTVGQTAPADFSRSSGDLIDMGYVKWGQVDPIPMSIELVGPNEVSFSESVSYKLMAKFRDGSVKDVSVSMSGAGYNLTPRAWWSTQAFAQPSTPAFSSYGDTLSADGRLSVSADADFSSRGGYQLLMTTTYEGIAVAKTVKVGAWSAIQGLVTRADGSTPVAGARVQIQRVAPSLRSAEVVLTDASGRYTSASTPVGGYKIDVTDAATGARGFATTALSLGSFATVNIALNGSGDVNVNVVGVNAEPVAGAQVVVTHAEIAGQVQSAVTSATGLAAIVRFMSGPVNVTVRDPANGAVGSAKINLQNAGSANVTVLLQPVGSISGRVLASDGTQAQAAVQVRLQSAIRGVVSQALSGVDGGFRFDALPLADGPYALQAYKNGQLQAASANLVLASSGQQLQQDLVFGSIAASGGTVTGRVVDQDGNALANTDVSLTPATGQALTAKSDGAGSYFFSSVPTGNFTLAVAASGYSGQALGSTTTAGASVTLNLLVNAIGEVRGLVVSATGQPAVNADVELTSAAGLTVLRTVTDVAGQYGFVQVPLGAFNLLVVNLATGERGAAADVLLNAAEIRTLNVALTPVGRVKVIVSSGGLPVAGATVGLTTQGKHAFGETRMSGVNGEVEFSGVPYGPFSVSAVTTMPTQNAIGGRLRGQLNSPLTIESLELRPVFPAPYNVTGRVLGANGDAIPNALVRLSSRDMPVGGTVPIPNDLWDEYAATSDQNGSFSFNGVVLNDDGRGRLKLDAIIGGVLRGRAILATPAGNQSQTKDIVLFDAGVVGGSVKTATGIPVAIAKVLLTHSDMALYSTSDFSTEVGTNGSYAVWMPTGSVSGLADSGGLSSPSVSMEVLSQRTTRQDFVLLGQLILSGRVLTRGGEPLANAIVRVNFSDPTFTSGKNYETSASSDGSYRMVLPGGSAYVSAFAQGRASEQIRLQLISDTSQTFEVAGISPRIKVIAETVASDVLFNFLVDGIYQALVQTGTELNPNFITTNIGYLISLKPRGIFGESVSKQILITPADEGKLLIVDFPGATVDLKVNVSGAALSAKFDLYIDGQYVGRVIDGAIVRAYLKTGMSKTMKLKDAHGNEHAATVVIRTEDSGKQIPILFNAALQFAKYGELTFGTERHLFKVPLQTGDVLSVSVHGDSTASASASYNVRASVFDPLGEQLASGYGFGSAFNFGQYNSLGDLKQVAASNSGVYPVQVALYYPQDADAGGYYLSFHVNGQPVAVEFAGGGSVQGIVQKSNGAPVSNQTVEIWAASGQVVDVLKRVKTDSNGVYRLDSVPLGDVLVKAIDGNTTFTSGSTTLTTAGQVGTVNLTLGTKTILNVTVRVAAGSPLPGLVNINVKDEQGERSEVVSFNGMPASNTVTVVAVGNSVTLKATHPSNVNLYSEKVIAGADGQTLNVELALVSGRVAGRAVNAAGEPMPNVTVTAHRQINATTGTYLTSTITDSQGRFDFPALAVEQSARLVAEDESGVRSAAVDVLPIEGQTVTVPDMRLASGTLQGRILFSNNTPVSNIGVLAMTYTGRTLYGGNTDEQGVYRFAAAPAGQPVEVSARHPNNNTIVYVNVVVVGETNTNAPDMIFGGTGTVSGRVLRANGTEIAGATVVLSDSAVSACQVGSIGSLRMIAITDGLGNYVINEVPIGIPLSIAANITNYGCIEQMKTVTALTANEIKSVPDFVFSVSVGTLRIEYVDAAGAPFDPSLTATECGSELSIQGSSGFSARADRYDAVLTNVPVGNYTATFISQGCGDFLYRGGPVAVEDGTDKSLQIVIPTVRVKVLLPNGTPATDNANVTFVLLSDNEGDAPSVFFGRPADGQGNYVIFGGDLKAGRYALTVAYQDTGIAKTVEGTLDTSGLWSIDVTLPALGSIAGRLLTSSGALAGNGSARIVSSEQPGYVAFYSVADGLIQPLWPDRKFILREGNNTIYFTGEDQAYRDDQGSPMKSYSQSSAAINNNLAEVALGDVYMLPFGTIDVTTLDAQGSAPQGSQQVTLQSARVEPVFSDAQFSKVSDSMGRTQFVVPAMPYNVALWAANYADVEAGTASVVVAGGQTTTVSVAKSGSIKMIASELLYRNALITEGSKGFMLAPTANLFSTGYRRDYSFYEGSGVTVNGFRLPAVLSGLWMTANRELQLGPYQIGNTIQVKRRLYVPMVGGYARLIDSFTNLTGNALTLSVVSTAQQRFSSVIKVEASATANNSMVFDWSPGSDTSTLVGIVYGDGIATQKPTVVPFGNPDLLRWTLTIPRGQTSSLLNFHVFEDGNDLDSVRNKITQIMNKTMPNMSQGLSAADKLSIKNFAIQP